VYRKTARLEPLRYMALWGMLFRYMVLVPSATLSMTVRVL